VTYRRKLVQLTEQKFSQRQRLFKEAGKTYILESAFRPSGAMRLTSYTDYSMRVLLYLGARPGRICSVAEISRAYGVSQNHLVKVVHGLGKLGYVASVRGRTGGIRLAKPAAEIRIGQVIRDTEDGFDLVDCPRCIIASACGLTSVLGEALAAFMAVLDSYTLADLLKRPSELIGLLGVAERQE
jgi:Rrf2 family nitric oxide-sensitive transcriptional repressor